MDCHATLLFEQYTPSKEEQNQVATELRKALEEDGLLFEINTSSMAMARSEGGQYLAEVVFLIKLPLEPH